MIIRNGKEAKGGVTQEELTLMKEHSEKWIKNAYRTAEINKDKITDAIKGLYRVSGLKEPRVVIVQSPKIAVYAWALAASLWQLRNSATDLATRSATDLATHSATDSATRSATDLATRSAARSATYSATDSATDSATYSAAYSATYSATRSATRSATDLATRSATESDREMIQQLAQEFLGEQKGIVNDYLRNSYSHYQGGNMWAAYECYLTAYRDILKLELPEHEKYKFWEAAALEGGFRYMHSEFCIVSDFPLHIKINKENQPHCDGGSSHKWRDGWELWHLNGVAVDQWMAETPPDELDVKQIMKIQNVDQRREVLRRLGMERFVKKAEAKTIDALILEDPSFYKNGEILYELLLADLGDGEKVKLLKMDNPSIDAIHVEAVHEDCMTVQESINWRAYGDNALTNKKLQWRPSQLT